MANNKYEDAENGERLSLVRVCPPRKQVCILRTSDSLENLASELNFYSGSRVQDIFHGNDLETVCSSTDFRISQFPSTAVRMEQLR